MTGPARRPPPYRPPPPDQLKLIHETDGFVVIDKPSGLLSVPGRGPEKAVCAQSITADLYHADLIVHRLDMDTSGLMLIAKTKPAQRALSILFQKREVQKTYQALVQGLVEQDEGLIELPIASYSLQRPLRHIDPDGQPSRTRWQVLTREKNTTRLALTPETGRSHQLRLHLSAIGHPILGDAFYGDEQSAPRLCLHASELGFTLPNADHPQKFVSTPTF